MIFLSPFQVLCKCQCNHLFFYTARHWNVFPADCFPLTHDLNDCKSRINMHLYLWDFSNIFLLCLPFLVTPRLVVAVQPCVKEAQSKDILKGYRSCIYCWCISLADLVCPLYSYNWCN